MSAPVSVGKRQHVSVIVLFLVIGLVLGVVRVVESF